MIILKITVEFIVTTLLISLKILRTRRLIHTMKSTADLTSINPSDLVITTQSFALLRKELFKNIGQKKAKGFLLRFGKELGSNKAKELMKKNYSIEELVKLSIRVHVKLGHVSAVETNNLPEKLEQDLKNKLSIITGKWMDSFEVDAHLEHHGITDECACYTLSGFASGYLSTIFNDDIFVKEITCRSKGDADCSYHINTKEYWQKNSNEDLPIYDDQTILNELEDTYDQLLFQRNHLNKIANFHRELTESIIMNNSIENVVKKAYEILNIPIVIEDLHGNVIALKGIDVNNYKKIILKNKNRKKLIYTTTYEKIEQIQLLTTPIFLQNKVFSFCSFIYIAPKTTDEHDDLFLEGLSLVVALCFLNEKVSFETSERLKISVLDRLVNKQYNSITEISSQLKYITPNAVGSFVTLSLTCRRKDNNQSSIDLYDQLLQLSKTLKMHYLEGLVSQHKDQIVILLCSIEAPFLIKKINKVLSHMEKTNKNLIYKIGISTIFNDLGDFQQSLKQAEQAVRLPRHQKIIRFEELGLLGPMLKDINVEDLKEIANKELGTLLDHNNKSKELLQTLYAYLGNNGKLEKTMQELSLSIGGIQYRIRKIEDIIQKDLKVFSTASYLLMLIESLILVGEIKIDISQ